VHESPATVLKKGWGSGQKALVKALGERGRRVNKMYGAFSGLKKSKRKEVKPSWSSIWEEGWGYV